MTSLSPVVTSFPIRQGWSLARTVLCALLLMGFVYHGLAQANYVYHERTTRSVLEDVTTTDCVDLQPYVQVLSPASGQESVLRFRVEYHLQSDQARVYYTTDGSDPRGSLGNGFNSTRVITAN